MTNITNNMDISITKKPDNLITVLSSLEVVTRYILRVASMPPATFAQSQASLGGSRAGLSQSASSRETSPRSSSSATPTHVTTNKSDTNMRHFARILLAINSIASLYLLIAGNLAPLVNVALLVAFILSTVTLVISTEPCQEALHELERED